MYFTFYFDKEQWSALIKLPYDDVWNNFVPEPNTQNKRLPWKSEQCVIYFAIIIVIIIIMKTYEFLVANIEDITSVCVSLFKIKKIVCAVSEINSFKQFKNARALHCKLILFVFEVR